MTTITFHLLAAFRSVVIIYKEKEPCKSAVKHSYKALMFTYIKELTPFMQRKKGSILLYQTFAFLLEQVTGIEPAYSAWEADTLPLSYTCLGAYQL